MILRVHTEGRSRQKITGDQRTMVPIYDFADKSSPCRESCPAGHDISWALHLVQEGRFDEAHRLFREESPFPSITGRVCYHPCETWCNRKDYDEPIAINALERAVSDYGAVDVRPSPVAHPTQPVAVVGSGPAGVTVAYHLAQFGYPVTVFEREEMLGGALRYGIPRYRLPAEVLDEEFGRLAALGIAFRTGCSVGKDIAWAELESQFRAIFLGVGLTQGRKLPVPGIEEVPARSGLEFLHAVNTGEVRELAGEVAVIGGGDVAIDVVRSSLRLGARAVHLYCLETRETMPAHPEEIKEALREGLYFNPAWAPQKISKAANGRIMLEFRGVDRLEEGLRPILNEKTTDIVVDHLFYAIGQQAEVEWVPQPICERGMVKANAAGQTALPHVFSGGDIAGSYNVVQAIGSGKRAAIAIDCFLQGRDASPYLTQASIGTKGAVSMRAYRELVAAQKGNGALLDIVRIDRINLDYFPEATRRERPELGLRERASFREVNGAFAREEAMAEAKRCFNCSECTVCGNCFVYCPDSAVVQREDGYFTIDGDHCKGCGQCVHECPRSAMTMVLEKGR